MSKVNLLVHPAAASATTVLRGLPNSHQQATTVPIVALTSTVCSEICMSTGASGLYVPFWRCAQRQKRSRLGAAARRCATLCSSWAVGVSAGRRRSRRT